MSLFYNDKKILAADWLLNYLYKNHCHKVTSPILEYNGYRGDVVKISDIPQKKYDYELLGEAANILSKNGHINYISKDHRLPGESKIHILEDGRQAVLSSFYKKILLKKWSKRAAWFLGVMLTVLGIWAIFFRSKANT